MVKKEINLNDDTYCFDEQNTGVWDSDENGIYQVDGNCHESCKSCGFDSDLMIV